MAVRVSAESGFDPGYMLKGQAEESALERTAGGYYITAAQAGEAPGRWFGRGAVALGFADGEVVEAAPFLAVYRQVHPVTGERMGRAPGGYAKTKEILARLLAGEPHATAERRLELEREAAQQTRRSPAYTDVTASHDKTISIVHAAIRESTSCRTMNGIPPPRSASPPMAALSSAWPARRSPNRPAATRGDTRRSSAGAARGSVPSATSCRSGSAT